MVAANDNKIGGRSKMHPLKFALIISCASIMMLFAGLTSAYIVRRAGGNWLEFRLPNLFFVNTIVVLLSSAALQASYHFFKTGKEGLYKGLMLVGFVLGMLFIVLQYQGWLDMHAIGVELTGNPAGSFVYVISAIHAAHILAGLAAITVALVHAFSLKFRFTPKRKLRFELTLIYWHFVGFLWLYLLTFFVIQS